MDWHAIHWPQVHRIVRRLQARIVQAVQAGRWGKVHALQHLLTHSFSGKALAVRRVTENPGKRTPGVDGDLWETPAKKAAAISRLRRRGYQARPLRRVWIPKPSSTKLRPLSIPTMQDRAMQALYLLALAPIAETTADRHSYGFRPERCTADALEQCRIVLSRHIAAPWIFEGDIQACFDEISHEWLLANIPMDKSILWQWLKAGFMMKHAWYPTETGTPQGGTISPVLCNLTLDGLEKRLKERFGRTKTGKSDQVNLVRWADDFVITGRTQALLEQEVKPLLEHFLRDRGLTFPQRKPASRTLTRASTSSGKRSESTVARIWPNPPRKTSRPFWRTSEALSNPTSRPRLDTYLYSSIR